MTDPKETSAPLRVERPWRQQLLPVAASFAWLCMCVNLRFPAETPLQSWLSPPAEVVALLALFALFAPRPGWLLPRGLTLALCAALLALRLGRIADGVCLRYLDRQFRVGADLTLVPEFGRLALSMLGPVGFALSSAGLLAVSLAVVWLSAAALRRLASALSFRPVGNAYLVLAGALALLAALGSEGAGPFARPALPRIAQELEFWLTAQGLFDPPAQAAQRRAFDARYAERQALLRAAPTDLQPTGQVDVHVLLVEAYGHTVAYHPQYAQALEPGYEALASALERERFFSCSLRVGATILGGNSWLTHATLQTAMPVADQFEYELFMARDEPATLAKSFRAAGYRTISVKPGTTRDSPHTRIYGFDREYNAPDLGYRGPRYAWAPMPDQFVLKRIAELELVRPQAPLFLEYALVSSHFPFDPHPPYVDDETSLGDGSVYRSLPEVRVPPTGDLVATYVSGYLSSIAYDLRVVADYVSRHVRGDGLVLVLGDHQPIAPVAGADRSRTTPLHVFSRRDVLLEPFRAYGCQPGVRLRAGEAQLPMEEVGLILLRGLHAPEGASARR